MLVDPQPQILVSLTAFQRVTVNQPLTVDVDIEYKFGAK